ncbi:alpha/beta hydrolase [Mucilaginibacter paludis]|uniref:Esterase n=1 Tax=Mucilaginibacter paludis DSM 18603 TaxID=714943 RepID=H1Y6N9_9SPHI|nr:alpha/beta hydrolase family protein [Mucilaginibacter paludis]EHQ26831.1 esterase [Mucilaginibacter paludis DSM 18603]
MRYLFTLLLLLTCKQMFAQETMVIHSPNLRANDTVWVYKPADYKPNEACPVVYLLHGHSGNYKSWSGLVNLQALANLYHFLIVCPDGLKKSWYINSPNKDSTQYEDFFIRELMPAVAKKFAVQPQNIFITGNSMGGYGAMYLFLRHPDLFKSAGSTSGVLNLRYSAFHKTTIAYLLGAYSESNSLFDSYSPVNLLQNIAGKNKTFIFDTGTEDYLYITSKKFREKCDELKLKATYIAQPGAHTGSYWTKSIPQHFSFFSNLVNAK